MSENDTPVVDQGGASAPPDVVSAILGPDGALLSSPGGERIGTYEILSSWSVPNGCTFGRLRAQLHGLTYLAHGRVSFETPYTVRFLSPSALSAAAKARAAKAHASRKQKLAQAASAPAPAPGKSAPQQLAATHAQPPVALEASVRGLRRHVVVLLKTVDPVGYRQYAEIKYAGTNNPSLGQRRRAYTFAFTRLMEVGYLKPNVD